MTGGEANPPLGLLQQMDDIKGLVPVAPWPLGPGWWVLLGLSVAVIVLVIIQRKRRGAWHRSWKAEAQETLQELDNNLTDANAQTTAATLSITLRRIAMQKFSRAECAGLEGHAWLAFLKRHDPRNFDWAGAGAVLIEASYAPTGLKLTSESLKPLLRAAKNWVP